MQMAFSGHRGTPGSWEWGQFMTRFPGNKGHRDFLAFRPVPRESALESGVLPAEGASEVPTPLTGSNTDS